MQFRKKYTKKVEQSVKIVILKTKNVYLPNNYILS